MLEPLYKQMKDILDKKVNRVVMSTRLVSFLHCIVTSQYGGPPTLIGSWMPRL